MIESSGAPVILDKMGEFGSNGEDEVDQGKPVLWIMNFLVAVAQAVILVQLCLKHGW